MELFSMDAGGVKNSGDEQRGGSKTDCLSLKEIERWKVCDALICVEPPEVTCITDVIYLQSVSVMKICCGLISLLVGK
jgi:hypothetical protein